jgi:hypothetical protein
MDNEKGNFILLFIANNHVYNKIPYLVSSDALDTKEYVQYNNDVAIAGTSLQFYSQLVPQ